MTDDPPRAGARRRALWHPFRRVSFGTILVTVLLASLIPIATLLVAVHVLVARQTERQQSAILRQAGAVLAAVMGARLTSAEASVAELSNRGYANPEIFLTQGMDVLAGHRHWQRLLLAGADGAPIAIIARQGTAVVAVAPSPDVRQPLPDPKAMRLLPFATPSGDIDIDVGVPIMRGGTVAGALWLRALMLPADGVGRLTRPFPHSDIVLVQSDGRVILSQRGTIRAATIPPAAGAGDEPVVRTWHSPQWGELDVAVQRLPGAPWSVAAVAAAETADDFLDVDRGTIILVLVAILLPLLAASIVARLLQQSMADVATAAHALTGDMPLASSRSGVVEIDAIQEALATAGQALAERASDRERLHAAELAMLRSQRAQAISLLMSAVAHDFGNLAFAISAQLERLRRENGGEAQRAQVIETAIGLAREASRMVSDLAQAARMPTPEATPTSIDAVIAEALDLLRRAAGRRIEIRHLRAAEPWLCDINPTMMRSALFNLVVNAAAAMPRGGPVSIHTRNITLGEDNPWDLPPGDYIHLAVSDAGIGMAPEVVEKVFDPFFTTRDIGEGNGLGLATVREFVLQAQGAIRAESHPGIGTTFHLLFPRWIGADHRPTA